MRVLINGFGRIGRLLARLLVDEPRFAPIELVAINDRSQPADLLRMLRYDSTHGRWNGSAQVLENGLKLGRHRLHHSAYMDVAEADWSSLDVELVLECSGRYTARDKAQLHLDAGAQKVLISAPGKQADVTCVYGVNHSMIQPQHRIISAASCTTNCLAPLLWPIQRAFGIAAGSVTTVHAYTSDQRLLDGSHADPRRGRSAALSIVPTKTGAASAIGAILPELNGRLSGHALRVPVANVSFVEAHLQLQQAVTTDLIHQTMQQAADHKLKNILTVNDEPLVSCDFLGNPHSAIYEQSLTHVSHNRLLRVGAWYDNEWAFSHRMLDLALHLARI